MVVLYNFHYWTYFYTYHILLHNTQRNKSGLYAGISPLHQCLWHWIQHKKFNQRKEEQKWKQNEIFEFTVSQYYCFILV